MAFTQEQEQFIEQSWKEFSDTYDFEKKFGIEALKQKLNAERERQGLQGVSERYVLDALGQLNVGGLQQDIDKHLTDKLTQAKVFRETSMTPRAKQRQEDVNENIIEQDFSQGQVVPPWPNADNIDSAANRNIRNAAKALADANRPAEFTTAFNTLKEALLDKLENQYKMRMAMRATPSRKIDTPKAGY